MDRRMESVFVSATTENEAQFGAVLQSGAAGLIYIDAAYTSPEDYGKYTALAHEAGLLCGLRLPHIWRREAGEYFRRYAGKVREAGFDRWLFRNMEAVLWFGACGLLEQVPYVTDHSMYVTNLAAVRELKGLLPEGGRGLLSMTCPLELNAAELKALIAGALGEGLTAFELTVYGRAPMMISAQCLQKTAEGCWKEKGKRGTEEKRGAGDDPYAVHETTLKLFDRKGAGMPVKNSCRFCFNTIYNAVPTAVYDLAGEILKTGAASVRYEFTTESFRETEEILKGTPLPAGGFTRGHFKKSVL